MSCSCCLWFLACHFRSSCQSVSSVDVDLINSCTVSCVYPTTRGNSQLNKREWCFRVRFVTFRFHYVSFRSVPFGSICVLINSTLFWPVSLTRARAFIALCVCVCLCVCLCKTRTGAHAFSFSSVTLFCVLRWFLLFVSSVPFSIILFVVSRSLEERRSSSARLRMINAKKK